MNRNYPVWNPQLSSWSFWGASDDTDIDYHNISNVNSLYIANVVTDKVKCGQLTTKSLTINGNLTTGDAFIQTLTVPVGTAPAFSYVNVPQDALGIQFNPSPSYGIPFGPMYITGANPGEVFVKLQAYIQGLFATVNPALTISISGSGYVTLSTTQFNAFTMNGSTILNFLGFTKTLPLSPKQSFTGQSAIITFTGLPKPNAVSAPNVYTTAISNPSINGSTVLGIGGPIQLNNQTIRNVSNLQGQYIAANNVYSNHFIQSYGGNVFDVVSYKPNLSFDGQSVNITNPAGQLVGSQNISVRPNVNVATTVTVNALNVTNLKATGKFDVPQLNTNMGTITADTIGPYIWRGLSPSQYIPTDMNITTQGYTFQYLMSGGQFTRGVILIYISYMMWDWTGSRVSFQCWGTNYDGTGAGTPVESNDITPAGTNISPNGNYGMLFGSCYLIMKAGVNYPSLRNDNFAYFNIKVNVKAGQVTMYARGCNNFSLCCMI